MRVNRYLYPQMEVICFLVIHGLMQASIRANVGGNYDYWIVKTDANGNRNHHATDPDGAMISWSISGGADAANFSINAVTGELTFVGGDYDNPQDADQDNTYEVTLRASDPSGLYGDQLVRISVTDANDPPTNSGPVVLTNANFQTAVDLWFDNQAEANAIYGHIGDWNTSAVTDMSNAFKDRANFNEDISRWNVSSVTNFGGMFRDAESFNQDLGDWDTSSANSMHQMFTGAKAFNQPIGNWNTTSVTNFNYMFSSAHSFNQDVSGWDVSLVTGMTDMFLNTESLSESKRGLIHESFSSNSNWPYNWGDGEPHEPGDGNGMVMAVAEETKALILMM